AEELRGGPVRDVHTRYRQVTDRSTDAVPGRSAAQVVAAHQEPARTWAQDADEQPQECGLARPVRTHQAENRTVDVEIDPGQCGHSPIVVTDVLCDDAHRAPNVRLMCHADCTPIG